MLANSESALVCDLAETYHVLNYRGLPLQTLSALAAGLGEDSRSVRGLTGNKVTLNTLLRAKMVDYLGVLVWQNAGCPDGKAPRAMVDILLSDDQDKRETFSSLEEFERTRNMILERAED